MNINSTVKIWVLNNCNIIWYSNHFLEVTLFFPAEKLFQHTLRPFDFFSQTIRRLKMSVLNLFSSISVFFFKGLHHTREKLNLCNIQSCRIPFQLFDSFIFNFWFTKCFFSLAMKRNLGMAWLLHYYILEVIGL